MAAQPPQQPYGQEPRKSWVARHKTLTGIGGGFAALVLIGAIATAAGHGQHPAAATRPGPAVTVTRTAPAVRVTVTTPAVRVTVTPTANAQGEATQISADGVYVIGQDIPGGTWHTSGGQQCYEATLSGLNTVGDDIINNDDFTGPDTVSLTGVKAFNISGGCTWQQEG
jgi:hypothetical protein